MIDKSNNFAKTTITGIASGVTGVVLDDATNFSDPASGEYNCVIWEISNYGNPADDPNKEIVRATALTGSTLTITRAQEGTIDSNHNTGGETYAIANVLTKKIIDDIRTDLSGKQDVLGFTPENVTNKLTTFQATPDDTHYASEKLVKDSLDAKAPSTSPIFATSITGSYLTASEILITDADKKIISAPVATYPSLTELSYVKGVSSAVQDQIDAKASTASPTFTGTVTLPKTVEIQDTSADHTYDIAVSELTADRTVTLPLLTGNDEFVFKDHTQTLTNKRINPRIVSATSYTTDTGTSLNISTCDQFVITAQAGALKFNNPGGTPLNGQKLIIRIKDNGTARALTYDTQFRGIGVDLPDTTVISKTLYMGFIFNATDTKWDLLAVAQEE